MREKSIKKGMISLVLLLFVQTIWSMSLIERRGISHFQKQLVKHSQSQIKQLLAEDQVPGIALALVDKKGVLWAQGFGYRGVHNLKPVNVNTLFSIESQTKMFTTLAIIKLVQQSSLSLTRPICDYLPHLKVYSVFQKNPVRLITLKHLLSHTAGFSHEAPLGNNFGSQVNYNQHIQSILHGTWLQFPVGTGYNYSNVGIDLAGYILQKNQQMPFREYMERHTLADLGMKQSTFCLECFLKSKNHADGTIKGLSHVPLNHSIIAAGGMYSNVVDMSHYLQFQLNHGVYKGKQLLNQHFLQVMLGIPYSKPKQVSGNALGIWKGRRQHTIYYSHLGRGFGFSDNLEWYPAYHIGIVVLTNKYDTNNTDVKISHLLIDPIIAKKRHDKLKKLLLVMLGTYVSNSQGITLTYHHNIILSGMVNSGPTGNTVKPMHVQLSYEGHHIFVSKKYHVKYRFVSKGNTGVPTLVRIRDNYMWYLNEPVHSKKGSNKKSWHHLLGTYYLLGYGSPMKQVVHVKHGYLYLNTIRLHQKEKNIFITPNGEVLIFSKHGATWKNLYMSKHLSKI